MSENIVVATLNEHKLKEIKKILKGRFHLSSLVGMTPPVSWDETGDTFEKNALIKAQAVAKRTNAYILADDSGLVVKSLGGAPGVFSSRYAGPNATDHLNVK